MFPIVTTLFQLGNLLLFDPIILPNFLSWKQVFDICLSRSSQILSNSKPICDVLKQPGGPHFSPEFKPKQNINHFHCLKKMGVLKDVLFILNLLQIVPFTVFLNLCCFLTPDSVVQSFTNFQLQEKQERVIQVFYNFFEKLLP